MRIAVLAWGSLYWDPRDLATTGEWFFDGPILPIEFARISSGNRLTLVIKPGFNNVTTLYAISAFQNLDEARENLRSREGAESIDRIGFVNFINNTQGVRESNSFIINMLRQWNAGKNFDIILWSDFSPNFFNKTNQSFNTENVITFLEGGTEVEKRTALQYIRNTPTQITTRFRNTIEQHFDGKYM